MNKMILRYYFKRFEVNVSSWSDWIYAVEFVATFESIEIKRAFLEYYEKHRDQTTVCSVGGLGYEYYCYFSVAETVVLLVTVSVSSHYWMILTRFRLDVHFK